VGGKSADGPRGQSPPAKVREGKGYKKWRPTVNRAKNATHKATQGKDGETPTGGEKADRIRKRNGTTSQRGGGHRRIANTA